MYDELIQRLGEVADEVYNDYDVDPYNAEQRCRAILQAADAIEQLTADLERSKEWEGFWKEQAEEAKGKLQQYALAVANKPRWIPVTERLPEEGVSVQVCFRSQGGIAQAVSERFVNDRNQSYWSGLCGMKPTNWMPLPEPPKEE